MSTADHKIYVGNLHGGVREKDLYEAFEKFGDVDRVFMKGKYAFVHMCDERDAADARRALDGRLVGSTRVGKNVLLQRKYETFFLN